MRFILEIEVDEKEAKKTPQDILDSTLNILSELYIKYDCYYNVGYDPNVVSTNKLC